MKINYLLITVLFMIFVTTSCKVHDGLTRNENQHQTQIVLSEKNYRIIKYVEGDATARYYFGIGGGSSKRGLLARARENMFSNAGLIGKSRAIINETVETQYRQVFFMTEVRYIVSAYIVEFYNPETETTPATEESVYVPDKMQPSPTETKKGITAGVTFEPSYNSFYDYSITHRPGFHLGYMFEFSKPDIKHLFWSTQFNISYLNTLIYNDNKYIKEDNFGFEVPFLLGLKYKLGNNFDWFIKGGPTLGFLLDINNLAYGPIPFIGGELYSGFQFGKHWQATFGHRWNIGYYEYDYSKISLNYLF